MVGIKNTKNYFFYSGSLELIKIRSSYAGGKYSLVLLILKNYEGLYRYGGAAEALESIRNMKHWEIIKLSNSQFSAPSVSL